MPAPLPDCHASKEQVVERVHDRYSGGWKLSDHCDRRRSEHLIPACDPPIRRPGYAEADIVLTTTGDADRIADDVR
jgi:hypothetical protein